MPFGMYSRVQVESDDDDEPFSRDVNSQRTGFQREGMPPLDAAGVVKSASQLGPSQPNVVQRGAVTSAAAGATVSTSSKAGGGGSVGNLIDFGEPDEQLSKGEKNKKKGSKQQVEQVELVTIMPTDPFDFLLQQRVASPAAPPVPPAPSQPDGYDPLQWPDHTQRQQQGNGSSSSGNGGSSGRGAGLGSLPFFGSFSDLASATGSQQQQLATHHNHSQQQQHLPHQARHSHSANDITDLLQLREAERESLSGGSRATDPTYQAPGVVGADRTSSGAGAGAAGAGPSSSNGAGGHGAARASASAPGSGSATPAAYDSGADGEAAGHSSSTRELYLYAVPLFKDKLVFLPVANWKEQQDTSTVLGRVGAGVSNVGSNISSMWHSLKDKDPGSFQHKLYRAGQAILENMNAEERLMRNIPKKANKVRQLIREAGDACNKAKEDNQLVIHHPASIPPDEVQDQLTTLTSSYCVKSAGKAAVAGVMLPVAVGLEVLFVPGIGWYTAYQLFKSTSAAAGGSRLNQYLKSDKSEVRICYVPNPKMDIYMLKARLSPDSILGTEDIEDLVHDIKEPSLAHPLLELRSRQLKKTQKMNEDYALLPMNPNDTDDMSSASSATAQLQQQPAAGAAGSKKHA